MVIGVGRALRLGQRILGQRIHDDLDGLIQLGIFSLPHELRIVLHFHVRNDTDLPINRSPSGSLFPALKPSLTIPELQFMLPHNGTGYRGTCGCEQAEPKSNFLSLIHC
jgi:hypothetical protein